MDDDYNSFKLDVVEIPPISSSFVHHNRLRKRRDTTVSFQ